MPTLMSMFGIAMKIKSTWIYQELWESLISEMFGEFRSYACLKMLCSNVASIDILAE